MCPASDPQKRYRYLLPVVFICFLVVLVSFSGCITGQPGLSKSTTSANSGPPPGTSNPAVYDTSQGQASGTPEGCGGACPLNSHCGKGECLCDDGYAATSDGRCIPAPTLTTTITGSGQSSGGGLKCPAGYESYTVCPDNNCYLLTSDPDNCGACNNACSSGQTCTNGQCGGGQQSPGGGATCPSPYESYTVCSGNCYDLTSDPTHCGLCTTSCSSGQTCVNGGCTGGTPPPASDIYSCNSNSDCAGLPKDSTFNQYHFAWECKNNRCIVGCQSPWTTCDTTLQGMPLQRECVNLQTDPKHCGSCGTTCTGTCTNSKCDLVFAAVKTTNPRINIVTTTVSANAPWTGTWSMSVTNTGPITMTQSGSSVSGTYTNSLGQRGCTISGGDMINDVGVHTLSGTWHEGAGSGPLIFSMDTTRNHFYGWWGLSTSDLMGRKTSLPNGNWNGQRQ